MRNSAQIGYIKPAFEKRIFLGTRHIHKWDRMHESEAYEGL